MKDTTELTRPKPTVNDIARVAGVSLATVDRVLNARPGVRDVTIEKVNKAIAELGFVRDTAAANLARRRQYRLMFILPETDNEFVIALDAEITAQSERLLHQRTRLKRRTIPPFDPQAMVRILDSVTTQDTDGVAIFGQKPHPFGMRSTVPKNEASLWHHGIRSAQLHSRSFYRYR